MGIEEQLKEIKDIVKPQVEEGKKPKEFKLPLKAKVKGGKLKKNYITVVKLNENRGVEFLREQIDEQTIMEDGIPRLASNQYIFLWKKNPMIFLPSWSVEPYAPIQEFTNSVDNGSNVKGYKILMAKMLSETVNKKKSLGGIWIWIIGLILLGVVAYAFLG
jgi:hypothetical protein